MLLAPLPYLIDIPSIINIYVPRGEGKVGKNHLLKPLYTVKRLLVMRLVNVFDFTGFTTGPPLAIPYFTFLVVYHV